MAHAEPPNRSRVAWPHQEPPEPTEVVEIPTHRFRSSRRQWAAIVALYLVVALNTYLVLLDHQYVVGRGQYRDTEAARIQARTTEQIRAAICDLLDGLPAGPLLDPKRRDYSCGPGIPMEQLPPDVQANLGELRGAQPEPGGDMVRPGQPSGGGSTAEESPVGAPPAAAPSSPGTTAPAEPATEPGPATPDPTPPAAPSTPGPAGALSPLTDTVCDLTGICL